MDEGAWIIGDPDSTIPPALPPFARVGDDVTVYGGARILHPGAVSVGSHVVIDDLVFIGRHRSLVIGSHVHLASHASITGGGTCVIGDYAGVSSGARLLSGTDDLVGGRLTGPTVPDRFRSVTRAWIAIGRHVVVGANAVVLPRVAVGEGAIVGAGAVVIRDVAPWTVVAGQPARVVSTRDPEPVLEAEALLRAEGPALAFDVRGTADEART